MFTTPITQWLDEQEIDYQLLKHSKATVTIADTARERGIREQQMVKTILLCDPAGQLVLACVPGDRQVSPQKVRERLQTRRLTCVNSEKLRSLTGFAPGTLVPMMWCQDIPIVFSCELLEYDQLTISSGSLMAGLLLNKRDLLSLCQPIVHPICR
ncbi:MULTISPECIES: aminoacyl-tRNA deacylase [unclassified Vibrio]|uniref:Aminoacyl-tRNA deacylase n=1 Tax=Vibrio sp. HB236076 TaxID=3232307 RepID=A0AB39HDP1_9VIBR|nr:YbaK/EbsC family protein [Vibrio sp. HB161653]MDP5253943.1 YbaK/EbsC family protein [Vibrio sp. HB161653]